MCVVILSVDPFAQLVTANVHGTLKAVRFSDLSQFPAIFLSLTEPNKNAVLSAIPENNSQLDAANF